jgi:hypothetical protein
MKSRIFYICFFVILALFSLNSAVFGQDSLFVGTNSQEITFFHPSGLHGFIIYDTNPDGVMNNEASYGRQSFDLSAELGLPIAIDVERFSLGAGSYGFQELLEQTGSEYLQIHSIQNALAYGPKSPLSPLYSGAKDITMIVATANYQATEKFSAKFSTGLSQ